jgi:hypothetical protein
MEGQDQGGVRGGLGPGHAVVRAGEEVLRAMPGWLSGMWANRFTYIPRPNWTRRAISRPKAQPRAARFLRSLLTPSACGTGAASSLVAAGSLLLASAIAHLRWITLVRLVMAAPGLVAGVFMRGSLHCCRDRGHSRGRGFAHAKPVVEVVR